MDSTTEDPESSSQKISDKSFLVAKAPIPVRLDENIKSVDIDGISIDSVNDLGKYFNGTKNQDTEASLEYKILKKPEKIPTFRDGKQKSVGADLLKKENFVMEQNAKKEITKDEREFRMKQIMELGYGRKDFWAVCLFIFSLSGIIFCIYCKIFINKLDFEMEIF